MEVKRFQLCQFDNFWRNFAYKKSSENSVINEVVDWFTTSDSSTIDLYIHTDLLVGWERGEVLQNSSSCKFLTESDLHKAKSKQRHKRSGWLVEPRLFDGAISLRFDQVKILKCWPVRLFRARSRNSRELLLHKIKSKQAAQTRWFAG
jgi:hypothetical protein